MRLHDWDVRLSKTVGLFRAKPFVWGESDCLLFAGACVEAVTGTDPAAPHRGTYDDEYGASRVIVSLGARDAPGVLASMLEEISPALARRGDLAVIVEPGNEDPLGAIGVVLGPVIAGYGVEGLRFVPRKAATRAFRID